MNRFYGFHGLLRRSSVFSSRNPSFCGNKLVKAVHSVHNNRHQIPGKVVKRKLRKSVEEGVDRKVYMRDTIRNIYNVLRYSTWESAQEQLKKLPIKWDSYTVNQVLKTHPPMEKAWLFFSWASGLRGFKHDQFTYTTMLDIFGEAGRITSMNYVFQQMQEKEIKVDTVTYTSLMHWLSNSGDVDGAITVWDEMRAKGCSPTVVSYTAYMKILFDSNRAKLATDIYKEMLREGLTPNAYTYTILMEFLIGSGKCEEALEIFSKMQEAGVQPDKAACNILIEKFCKAGETEAIGKILEYMKENRIVLRYPVFLEALETLKACGKSDALLRQVHPHLPIEEVSESRAPDCATYSDAAWTVDEGLLLVLIRKRNFIATDRLLTGMINNNLTVDSEIMSTIIQANCSCSRPDGALLAYECCLKMGVTLGKNAYMDLVGVFLRSTSFPKVVDVVQEMISAGHSLGTYQSTLLIHRLGKARSTLSAVKIFDLLPDDEKCAATYTALISAYFYAGGADKGLKIYGTMQRKGILPSLGTYNVLLTGLEKCRRASEAEVFRKEKKILQAGIPSQTNISDEQKICDLIFGGQLVS